MAKRTEDMSWHDGRIRDEDLEYVRSLIGAEQPLRAWHSAAYRDAIWHFALGVGDDNPLWWDPAYAEQTQWGRPFAPSMFLYTFMSGPRRLGDEVIGGVEDLFPGVLGIWGGDRWTWNRQLWEGERVTAHSALHSVTEKESRFGGRAVLQTDRVRFVSDDDGDEIAVLDRDRLRFERGSVRDAGRYDDYEPATYTPEEFAEIGAQYEREHDQRRGAAPLQWAEVQIGQSIGTLVKGPLTITNLVGWVLGWGSPLCQTNRIAYLYLRDNPGARLFNPDTGIEDTLEGAHWDRYYAHHSGMPDPYDFGGQRIAWIAHLVSDWMGDTGFVRSMDARLRRPNLLGETSWITGSVTGTERDGEGTGLVHCSLEITNQAGNITTTADVTVELPG